MVYTVSYVVVGGNKKYPSGMMNQHDRPVVGTQVQLGDKSLRLPRSSGCCPPATISSSCTSPSPRLKRTTAASKKLWCLSWAQKAVSLQPAKYPRLKKYGHGTPCPISSPKRTN